MKRILITAGGTGGHIFPALAVADTLGQRYPDCQILFVGGRQGMEQQLVSQAGYTLEQVDIAGLKRSLRPRALLHNLGLPFRVVGALLRMWRLFRDFRPEAVLGFGGYASLPAVAWAARNKRIPLLLQEQNAYPGLVNRWFARRADWVLLGDQAAAQHLPGARTRYMGNPVRSQLSQGDRGRACSRWNLDPGKPILLVLGGSLGAQALNDVFLAGWPRLQAQGVQLLWPVGRRYYQQLRAQLAEEPGLALLPFINEMEDAYAAADLVVCRAGALTLAELAATNKPALVVPSPNVVANHQQHNAEAWAAQGGAEVIPENQATSRLLERALALLQPDSAERTAMQAKLNALPKPQAATVLADTLEEALGYKPAPKPSAPRRKEAAG